MPDEAKRLCIVIDRDGNPWGPFEAHLEAVEWAEKKWPGEGADAADPALQGWEVVALRSPDHGA